MPRSRSRSAPATPRKRPLPPPRPPPPAPAPTPVPTPVSGGPSMLDSLKHGMGVGAGLEVSRQLIQGISGVATGSASTPVSPTQANKCDFFYENMMACIHDKDMDSCDMYMESYRECKSQQ